MRRWHWIALVICGAATIGVWVQGQKIRQSTASLQATIAPDQVAEAPVIAEPISSPTGNAEQMREMARLRNQATQLRSKKKELESARRDNTELIAAGQAIAAAPPRQTPPGFVSKEGLANVGYATPESAMQTFFWAMREGNFDAVVASFSPTSKERQRFEQMPPEQREKLRAKMNGPGRSEFVDRLADVGVRGTEMVSEDIMHLHVGSSLSTNTVRMRLDRTPEGWKIHTPGF